MASITVVVNTSACMFCDFFRVDLYKSLGKYFIVYPHRRKINDMEPLSVGEGEIVDRIRKLNI